MMAQPFDELPEFFDRIEEKGYCNTIPRVPQGRLVHLRLENVVITTWSEVFWRLVRLFTPSTLELVNTKIRWPTMSVLFPYDILSLRPRRFVPVQLNLKSNDGGFPLEDDSQFTIGNYAVVH